MSEGMYCPRCLLAVHHGECSPKLSGEDALIQRIADLEAANATLREETREHADGERMARALLVDADRGRLEWRGACERAEAQLKEAAERAEVAEGLVAMPQVAAQAEENAIANLQGVIHDLRDRLQKAEVRVRQEIGLIIRQRAGHLRDQLLESNIPCARELESLAVYIEQDGNADAPLAEATWLHEVATLRDLIVEIEEDRDLALGASERLAADLVTAHEERDRHEAVLVKIANLPAPYDAVEIAQGYLSPSGDPQETE